MSERLREYSLKVMFLICAIVLGAFISTYNVQAASIYYGDLDMNGKITTTDMSVMIKINNGQINPSTEDLKRGDLNGDSKINAADAELLAQYIVGQITEFPVEKLNVYVKKELVSPIYCYAKSNEKITTYKSVNGAISGYIDGTNDVVTILEVYEEEGWCKVSYPTSSGSKEAYVQSTKLFNDKKFSTGTIKLGENKTVYKKLNMKQSYGTVYAQDDVIIVGNYGVKTQIIYPLNNGGYKMGWIKGKYEAYQEQVANITEGYYQIKTALNSKSVLDIYGASTSGGANLQLCQNNGGLNQIFLIRKEADDYYSITPVHARNQRLDVEYSGKTNGTNISQWQSHGKDNQKWKIVKATDGYYSIISKVNGLYMDVNGASTADETNIQCYEGNRTLAQKFILEEVKVNGKKYSEESTEQTTPKEDTNDNETLLSLETDITVEELCFNHIYYADKYSDLKKAYGYDRTQLLSHWKQHGIREGRSASPVLDLTHYLQNNKDLQKAFGNDYTQAYNHFLAHGYKEFRNSSPYYNGETYRNNYKDLKPYDSFSLLYHYCQYGIGEGRQAGEKKYTGSWDYSVCESSSSERKAVVAYMKSMATIEWTPSKTFKHWSYGMEGGSNRYWCAGTTYYGIPYTQKARTTTLEAFKANMSGKIYVGPAGQSTYMGNDCSSAVAMAYSRVNKNFIPANISTYVLYPVSGYTRKVGEYKYNASKNSATIISDNTKTTMLQSYAKLQIGDLVVQDYTIYKNGKYVGYHHVMMVTAVGSDYVKVTHQTTYDSSRNSTWRVDEKYTFESLYSQRYVPVTMKEW